MPKKGEEYGRNSNELGDTDMPFYFLNKELKVRSLSSL
jgi:hypothetical protein